MKIIFCQISTNLINKDIKPDISTEFYSTFWTNKQQDGFYKPEHFWEIPLWIAEMAYTIPNDWGRELHVVTDIDKSIEHFNNINTDIIAFSCLDVNKSIIEAIINRYSGKAAIAVGGYVKPESKTRKYTWYSLIKDFCNWFQINYKYGLDYSLFKDYKTIPRLTLSTGCKHQCKFCTVLNEIVEIKIEDIYKQVDSFKPLNFELIYLNDKTFGQAKNYFVLSNLYSYIVNNINPYFRGFIVQTTCNQITKPGFIDFIKLVKIKYIELGIETCNDEILSSMKKPQNLKLIHKALKLCNDCKLDVIPNIIIGLPNETIETYNQTLTVLQQYKLYSLNIYNLAVYEDSALSDEFETSGNDNNELIKDKSYHTKLDRVVIDSFYKAIYELGCNIIK